MAASVPYIPLHAMNQAKWQRSHKRYLICMVATTSELRSQLVPDYLRKETVMLTSICRTLGVVAVAAFCAVTVSAENPPAQQPRPAAVKANEGDGQAAGRPNQATGERTLQRTANKPVIEQSPAQVDQMIAGMLALCNEEEATIGKFAATHAQHDEVKKFATTMAKEHAEMAKRLQKWAPEATLAGQDNRAESARGASFDPLQVHQQIATRSIASAEKSLNAKKGIDFDMAYVGSQCVLHQQMIDKASVLREYASPDLQAAIDKGIQSAESHLNHSHQLIEELANAERTAKDSK